MEKLPLTKVSALLLVWYDTVRAARDMPWRETRDPYAIWVSEIMLQQTQVETVKPYYRRFLERFPTVAALAGAPLQDVLGLWAGLGYYRRAKHLHAGAGEVVRRFKGELPATVEELRSLPGIGRYTAGAIGSIAFELAAPVVDGNVMRVLSRVMAYDKDIAQSKHQEFFWEAASQILAPHGKRKGSEGTRYGDINQALMELGSMVCTPVNPKCGECPLRTSCRAFAEGRQDELPVKSAKKAASVIRLVSLVILREAKRRSKVLVMQRPTGGIWESMWEFPTFEAKKTFPSARTFSKALGLTLEDAKSHRPLKHQLTHRTIIYQVAVAHTKGEKASLPTCPGSERPYAATRWVDWPLNGKTTLPMATVVSKIAAAVTDNSSS